MKLRNTIKIAALAGLTTMALPMTTQAAPLSFGGWNVATGVIDSPCASNTGATCNTLVTGEGFLQEQVSIGSTTYIHTVITDPNADGTASAVAYSDESYVVSGGTTSGIAAKQVSNDAAFNFSGSTTLYTGWAATTAGIKVNESDANLNINQSFSDKGDTGVFGDEFTSSFGLKINLDSTTGAQTGKSMSIGQVVEMGDAAAVNTSDIQRFVIEQRTGSMSVANSQAGGLTLGTTSYAADGTTALNGTAASAPVTWAAGDDVMMVWLGQKVSDGSTGGGLSIFGYESVAVVPGVTPGTTTPTGTASQFATTFSTDITDPIANNTDIGTTAETTPFNWDSAALWGAAPVLPVPAIDASTDAGACQNGVDTDGVTCL